MADEVKNAGIGYILKNSYRTPTHGIIKRDINFRACQMILDFDGAVGWSSLDHYTIGDTIFLHIHLFALSPLAHFL
jgi:hypothetical protein